MIEQKYYQLVTRYYSSGDFAFQRGQRVITGDCYHDGSFVERGRGTVQERYWWRDQGVNCPPHEGVEMYAILMDWGKSVMIGRYQMKKESAPTVEAIDLLSGDQSERKAL